MLISYNWLKEYVEFDLPVDELTDILTNTGLEVEEVVLIDPLSRIPEKMLVGHVIDTEKHPDADKLTICKVDTGESYPLQIICGAPNVSKGQKVAVAPVGVTLENKKGEKLKLKRQKYEVWNLLG